jgi:hypothetical protein
MPAIDAFSIVKNFAFVATVQSREKNTSNRR